MALIRTDSGEKQTYGIFGPGPGDLPEGFKGRIGRCESVCNESRSFPPTFSNYSPSNKSRCGGPDRRIRNALRAIVAFESPRPRLPDFTKEMTSKS